MIHKWTGMFFEDFKVGDVYEHPFGRTITESDNIWFTNLTMNAQQLHFNKHYAEDTEFREPLVNSCLVFSIMTGLSVIDFGYNLIANLGWDKVECLSPVYVGDTIYAKSSILCKNLLETRPNSGIVKISTIGSKQDGTVVLNFHRKFMVKTKC